MISQTLETVRSFKIDRLKELYSQLTEPQQRLFDRMYPILEEIEEEKFDWAVQQCERTLAKNTPTVQTRRWDDVAIDEGRIIS